MNQIEAKIRKLAAVEEKAAILKKQAQDLRESISKDLNNGKIDKVETMYGYVQLRDTPDLNYSEVPEVQAAILELEAAKAQLGVLMAAYKEKAVETKKKTFAFNRNKAVSAIARGKRVYVSTIVNTGRKNAKLMAKVD